MKAFTMIKFPQQTAEKIIRDHYRKTEPLSLGQVMDEIANLRRKEAKGNLDDSDQRLFSMLSIAGYLERKQPYDNNSHPYS